MKVSPKGLEFLEKVKRKYFLGEWSICAEIVHGVDSCFCICISQCNMFLW